MEKQKLDINDIDKVSGGQNVKPVNSDLVSAYVKSLNKRPEANYVGPQRDYDSMIESAEKIK